MIMSFVFSKCLISLQTVVLLGMAFYTTFVVSLSLNFLASLLRANLQPL